MELYSRIDIPMQVYEDFNIFWASILRKIMLQKELFYELKTDMRVERVYC